MAGPGLTFAPTLGDSQDQKDTAAQLSPTQRAIQTISLRLPRVFGAKKISPRELMNAQGSAGNTSGLSAESAMFQTLQKTKAADAPTFATGQSMSASGSGGGSGSPVAAPMSASAEGNKVSQILQGFMQQAPSAPAPPRVTPGIGNTEVAVDPPSAVPAPTIQPAPVSPAPVVDREPMVREPRIPDQDSFEPRTPRVPSLPAPQPAPPVEYPSPSPRPPQSPRDPNAPIDVTPVPPPADPFAPPPQGRVPNTPRDPNENPDIQGPNVIQQVQDMLGSNPNGAQTVAQIIQSVLGSMDEDQRRRLRG